MARIAILWLLTAPMSAFGAERDVIRATQALFDRARQQVQPSVVRIATVGGAQPLPGGRGRASINSGDRDDDLFRETTGSRFMLADGPTTGIVYSSDGLILTSSFNFVRNPAVVTVMLHDGRELAADILGRDRVRKLTLLKIDADDLTPAEWTPRHQIRVGQWAIALGKGVGSQGVAVSTGIISALNRMMGNAIQTDANLSPVNYGGPLVDTDGRVMGICVPMAQRPGELAGVELYDSGIGFAVPGWRVREIVETLRKGQSFDRGWLGMQIDPRSRGDVRILRMADPSPLRDAGAQSGDVIVAINSQPIKHYGHLVKSLYMIPAGETVDVRLLRDADYIDLQVTLARSSELGSLPRVEEPFDPSRPEGPPQDQTPAPE